jgi:hypothetical protein
MSLGRIVVDLLARTGSFETDINRASKLAARRAKEIDSAFNKGFKGMAAGLAGFASAVFSVQAVFQGFTNAIDQADKLNDFNQRLGISAEALSGWGYAAKQSGTDIDALGIGLKKLAKNMADALDPKSGQAKVFESLGVSVKDAQGNLRSLEDMLPDIADGFKKLNNETLEAALAQELFGKSGTDLLEFLNQGASGLDAMRARARELGIELSQDTLTAADAFNDKVNDLKAASQGLFTQLAAELLPALSDLVDKLTNLAKDGQNAGSAIKWIGEQAAAAVKDLDFLVQSFKVFKDLFVALKDEAFAYYGLLRNIATMDFSGAAESLAEMRAAGDRIREAATRDVKKQAESVIPAGLVMQMDIGLGAPMSDAERKAFERRVAGSLSGGGGGSKKAGKSDADKEADRLKARYDEMVASLNEQIALTGVVSETEQLRWQLANTGLSKLSEAEKANLLALQQSAEFRQKDYEAMQDQIKLDEERAKQIDESRERTDELIADMEFELALLGMTNKEREREIALRHAGADATDAQKQRIIELADSYDQAARVAGFYDEAQRGLGDAFYNVAKNASDAEDIVKGFFDSLADYVTRMISEAWAQKLADLFKASTTGGEGGSGGGWVSSILGALFGGGRANGGPVMDGGQYLVGERGPELFVPRTAGMIVPAAQTARMMGSGPSNFTQNVMVQGKPTKETLYQLERASAKGLARSSRRG